MVILFGCTFAKVFPRCFGAIRNPLAFAPGVIVLVSFIAWYAGFSSLGTRDAFARGAEATFHQVVEADADDLTVNSQPEVTDQELVVSLTVDYGDNSQRRYAAIVWEEGMSVLDVLERVSQHPRGVSFKFRGSGRTAFLFELDGVANQGTGGKNWLFQVGGEMAKQSFASTFVQSGDDILWQFR